MKILTALILTLICAASGFAQKQAEVVVTFTYLRQSPDSSAEKVQTVRKGEKVRIEKKDESDGWYYVSVANGTVKGWIRKDTISTFVNAEKNAAPEEKTVAVPPSKPIPDEKPPSENKPNPVEQPKQTDSPPMVNQVRETAAAPPEATAATAAAATPTPTPAVIEDNEVLRIDTDEVSLNVRVLNKTNRPVGGLDQAQFKVYEDDVLQPITSLTTTEVPLIDALVIDNSRSLHSQLSKIIEAGKIIVGTNRPIDQSAVVRFVSSKKIEVVQNFTSNKNSLENALDNLYVEGGQTAIVDAVYHTAKKLENYQNSPNKDDVKLRSLILVTDGDDRASQYDEQRLFKFLREANVQIYVVGFINALSKEPDAENVSRQDKAKSFLLRLAQETGGKIYFPDSIDELPKIAADIAGELHTEYLISYAPTNSNRDGTYRKIHVEVEDGANSEKRTAVTRTGRNTLPDKPQK